MTQGPIAKTLLLFALPTLGSSMLQSLNGSINAVWVGRFLGEAALAATSNATLVMFLMFSGIFGFAMAATILVGQNMGRRDIDSVRRVVGTAVTLFAVVSVLIAALGWIFTPALLRLLGTPDDVYPLALAYLRVIFLGFPFSFLTVLLTMSLRGTGDSLTPLWFFLGSAVIDVALNPVFILGLGPAPAMGIAGSAVATLIAGAVGLTALVIYIQARGLTIRLKGAEWAYLRPDPALLRVILFKGVPMGLQMVVLSVSALAMIGLVNRQGVVTVAAYGVTSQLWAYIQMPAMALAAAVSAMAAQNIGAGRWDRVERIAWSGSGINVLMTGAMVVLITLIDVPVLGLFLSADSPAIGIARHIHLLVSWSFILFGVSIVLSGVVRANGSVIAPLIILAVAALPVRLGLAYTLEPRFGADGIWWSFGAGSVVSVILILAYFRWGRWREGKLLAGAPPLAEPTTP
ncbi:MATE family efflux transporter [Glacieibacterium frigidum]|uniref:MATE family efflux transporter n=1 Tax=Glacieibacterium frigidum TaxID=2593303 RepID=A0A552UJQ0_9SPHN|nr:MATE family efflux transporter [Glacieibacterium frigidum]